MNKVGINLLLIDKPSGITSFDVLRKLKKKLGKDPKPIVGQVKLGHAGTLDPRASGLLLVGVGDGTKKLRDLIGLPKVYIAEILLGTKTDTGDMDGKIIEEKEVPKLSEKEIVSALNELLGDNIYEVSLYSAMKRKGKPLYKYAREGKEVTKPKRVMTVVRADLITWIPGIQVIEVGFEVGSGTYIRSLAEVLGEKLGTVATLRNLRRISVGDYKVEDAQKI